MSELNAEKKDFEKTKEAFKKYMELKKNDRKPTVEYVINKEDSESI